MSNPVLQAYIDSGGVSGYVTPGDFATTSIDFSHDLSARQTTFDISLTPYLVPIFEQWDFRGAGNREIVVMAPEQTAKSLSWQLGLIWSFLYEPGLSMVVYPSDEKCDEINRAKLQPLMRSVPTLAAGLSMPKTKAKNRYNFPGFISYFQGAVERISAHSARIRVADEVDDWEHVADKKESPKLEDLKKRARTFDDSLFVAVSSPKGESKLIYPEFQRTSQGYWHLRCLECGELSLRSCDIHNLQFETTESDGQSILIPGSERLRCPKCQHEHVYSDRREMNLKGDYIHRVPELVGRRTGFQWGALASQWESLSWSYIAEKQLAAGSSADIRDQTNFDNSIRGLPFRARRKKNGDLAEDLLQHCAEPPDPATVEGLFLSVDTQDTGWRWELRALTVDSNRHLLKFGNAEFIDLTDEEREQINAGRRVDCAAASELYEPVQTLADVLSEGWQGIPVTMALIDEGGHRKKAVEAFVRKYDRAFAYKGGWSGGFDSGDAWAWSKNQPKLILARRGDYQDRLLYYLHYHDDRQVNYWYLPPRESLTTGYIDELMAIRPNAKKRDGHLRQNWSHDGRVHDYFDTGLIYLVLEDVAIKFLDPSEWRHRKAAVLFREDAEPQAEPETAVTATSGAGFVQSWR
jgi:hypothetical protein